MHKAGIINKLIQIHGYKRYLEIGVRNPVYHFDHIVCDHKDGVDPTGRCNYRMTSDAFFSSVPPEQKYDIVMIDGMHEEFQVDRDIENSLVHLIEGGTVCVHDSNPPSEWRQRSYEEYKKDPGAWNGTVWKSIAKLRMAREELMIVTLNEPQGLTLIRPGAQGLWVPPLEYPLLAAFRKSILNIQSIEKFLEEDAK